MDQPLDLSCHKNNCVGIEIEQNNLDEKIKRINKDNCTGRQAKSNKNILPCEICRKNFDRPSLLKRHLRTHTGEKPHVCETCNKGFSTSSSLNTHRRIHSGVKPHVCGHCGKRFTASSNLYYHRMTHTKVKPHKCTICTKSFPTPGDLRSHMYVHSGCWPFRCDICSRGFSKQTNLKNHYILHTGDKPHKCNLCNKRFALACNLRTHLKLHHEDTGTERCEKVLEHSVHVNESSLADQHFSLNSIIPEIYKNIIYEEFQRTLLSFKFPFIFPTTFQNNLTFNLNHQNLPK